MGGRGNSASLTSSQSPLLPPELSIPTVPQYKHQEIYLNSTEMVSSLVSHKATQIKVAPYSVPYIFCNEE